MSVRSYTAFGVASYIVPNFATVGFPCYPVNIQGFNKGADGWLQVHDATDLPANTAVPLKSFAIQANFPFSWRFDPTGFPVTNGLVLAYSSTEATLTVGTGGNTCDWIVDVEEFEQSTSPTPTIVGDVSTSVNSRQIWASASGPHFLRTVVVVEISGENRYLMQFAKDSPADGTRPIQQWPLTPLAANYFDFGNKNVAPLSQDADFTLRKGCTFVVSTTTGVLTAITDTNATIKASYI